MSQWEIVCQLPPEYLKYSNHLTVERLAALMEVWAAKIDEIADQTYAEGQRVLAHDPQRQRIWEEVISALPRESAAGRFWLWLAKQFSNPALAIDAIPLQTQIDAAQMISEALIGARRYHLPLPQMPAMDMNQMVAWAAETNYNLQKDQISYQHPDPIWQSGDGWTAHVVHPEDALTESTLMKNCLRSYRDTIGNGQSRIVSLRDPQGAPHVNIGYSDYGMTEARGVANQPVKREYEPYLHDFEDWRRNNPDEFQAALQRVRRPAE